MRLKDEEIQEAAIVCWAALTEHEKQSFRLVAQKAIAKYQAHYASLTPRKMREEVEDILGQYSDNINAWNGWGKDPTDGALTQILSLLALIDKNSAYYKQVVEGYGCVIPLAEALKEK